MLICDKTKCTGCGLCNDICPVNCITINFDKNGFYQSSVDESKCINCQKCVSLCPANHPNNCNKVFKSYKMRRKDKEKTIKSTSGGIASLISEAVVSNGGTVIGCGFDEKKVLRHSIAQDLEALESFKGSKYIQSNVTGIYKEIKNLLKEDRDVLFIGTPCQVSALCHYLSKPYEKLVTIDLACHGVSSQKVLQKYLESIETEEERVKEIRFRNKENGYKNGMANAMQYVYESRIKTEPYNSGFGLWFASGLSIRESCYQCEFASELRCADITLADYRGELLSNDERKYGVSLVFVNTEKGKQLLKKVSNNIVAEEIELDKAIKMCTRLYHKASVPPMRKRFFKDLDKLNIDELKNKYTLKRILPSRFFRYFKAAFNKIKKL